MRLPLVFRALLVLCFVSHSHAFRFSSSMEAYEHLSPQVVAKVLAKIYEKNPDLKNNLHTMTDSDINLRAKEIATYIESFYSKRSLSSTTPRYQTHKKTLIDLLKKDREFAQVEWIQTHPIEEQKDFSNLTHAIPEGALELLGSEAAQRYPQNKVLYQKWKDELPLLKDSDQAKKKEIQYEIARAIDESHQHRRHILQERLGQLPHHHESELLERATSLSTADQISLPELYELLDAFSLLTQHNHTLADRLSKMGERNVFSLSEKSDRHEVEIDKQTLDQVNEKLNKIDSYRHVLTPESRPVYDSFCTLIALNILLDPSFPKEKISKRLNVLQHLPQWDSEQIHELLVPGDFHALAEWNNQIERLEEKLKEFLIKPDRYKDILTYFSSAYPEKFQKVEARISAPDLTGAAPSAAPDTSQKSAPKPPAGDPKVTPNPAPLVN